MEWVTFTCITTHTIHLKTAGDLSTDSFILALCCFMTLWGNIKYIQSDYGTNSKGAQKELEDVIVKINISKIVSQIVNKNFNYIWISNPP